MQPLSGRKAMAVLLQSDRNARNQYPVSEYPKGSTGLPSSNGGLRQVVLERDRYSCRYCGIDDYPVEWLVLEHVDPFGPTTLANLVAACRSCNKLKGRRTPEQAGMAFGMVPVSATSRYAADWARRTYAALSIREEGR